MSRYVNAGKKLFQFLVPKTNVPKTNLDKAKSSLKIQKHKTKRRVKKLLKGLGVGAALLGAGKALMNRRDKANQMKEFLATEGGDISKMFTRPNMRDIAGSGFMKPRMMNAQELDRQLMELNEGTDFGLGPLDGAKDGGRITKSGVKRRTKKFAKKKKQANKMRKK